MAEKSSHVRLVDPARDQRLARANINPATGLASDYLNHFNEAIMLLEMLADCPDCADDLRAWRPKSYREHFAQSGFRDRMVAIEAYDEADPAARHCLETLADTMTAILESARAAMGPNLSADAAAQLAKHAAALLKPLVARAGSVINGELVGAVATEDTAAQDTIDALFDREVEEADA